MSVRLNDELALWCASVLQPARAEDVESYIKLLFKEAARSLNTEALSDSLRSLESRGFLLCVQGCPNVDQLGDCNALRALGKTRF